MYAGCADCSRCRPARRECGSHAAGRRGIGRGGGEGGKGEEREWGGECGGGRGGGGLLQVR